MAWGDPPGTQDLGLATEPSRLQSFLELLNRPNLAKNAVLKDLVSGKGDMGHDVMEALRGHGGPQGADVIRQLSGYKPGDTAGKILEGVGGFGLDVLTDPLNALGIGPEAKGAEKLFHAGEQAPGVFNQMRQGQRAAASFAGAETPEFINKFVGEVGGRAGNLLNAIPGADMVKNAFTPAYTKLRTTVGKMTAGAQDFITQHLGGGKDLDAMKSLLREGSKTIGDDIPEDLNKVYDAKGLTPMEKMFEEINRKGESRIDGGQGVLRHQLKNELELTMQKLESVEPDLKDMEHAKYLEKLLNIIDKYPINTGSFKNEAVNKISDMLAGKNEELLSARKAAGYDPNELEDYLGRKVTPEGKELLAKRGDMAGGPGGMLSGPTTAERIFKEYSKQQVEEIFKDDFLRQKMFGITEPLEGNKSLWQAIASPADEAGKNAPTFYERNPLTAYGYQVQNTGKAVASADAMRDIAKNFASDTPEKIMAKGGQPILWNVPSAFEGILGKKKMFVDSAIADELNKLTTSINNPEYINDFLKVWDNITNGFKMTVLFGTPIVGYPTASKYLMGHAFIAWMKDGISSVGTEMGLRAAKTGWQREALLKQGPEGIEKWKKIVEAFPKVDTPSGPMNPLKIAEEYGILKAGNKFDMSMPENPIPSAALEKAKSLLGVNHSLQAGEAVDTFGRVQYLTTMLKNGYSPEQAALKTIRDLYDYTGGLSPFEQNVMRRLIPFYSWMRFNMPSMLFATLQHPGKADKAIQFIGNMEATIGKPKDGEEPNEKILDQFINGQLHMRVYQDNDGKWHYFTMQHYLPLADLEGFSSVGRGIHELTSALNPMIKSPIELLTNQSMTFEKPGGGGGQEIERYPGETTNFLGLPLQRKYANLISENVRPLNELNAINPNQIFGTYKEANALGAMREQTNRTPFEEMMRLTSIHFTPIDYQHSAVNAHYAFERALQQLNIGEKRAQKMGKLNDIQNLEDMKAKLFNEAIPE